MKKRFTIPFTLAAICAAAMLALYCDSFDFNNPYDSINPSTVTVSSAGTGASGGGTYAAGTTVSINAGTAPAGRRFRNWTSTNSDVRFADSGRSATSFTMPAREVTVTANFLRVCTLTVNASPGGTVEPVGVSPRDSGATVSVTATADANYRFTRWTGASTDTTSRVSITMNENKTLTANFIRTFTLSATSGGNGSVTVTPTGTAPRDSGTTIIVTATPNTGYGFVNWTGTLPEDIDNTKDSIVFNIKSNVNMTANFVQGYRVTVLSAGTGSSGGGMYAVGDTVTINAGTFTGYQFKKWSVLSGVVNAY